ncbi:MAG: hypothetical protein BJG00_004045 [Limnothrix sp. CACIAM 69d]|nr:MAG: hypothetical protein BJG00_004045 [Limnothrix sp. CACIAM 69d]
MRLWAIAIGVFCPKLPTGPSKRCDRSETRSHRVRIQTAPLNLAAFHPLNRPDHDPAQPDAHPHPSADSDQLHQPDPSAAQHLDSNPAPSHAHGHSHGPSHSHTHAHNPEAIRKIVNRLSRIEGHVRGIKAMVQDGRDCPDVLIQLAAVRGAIDRVARAILDEHLNECIVRAAREGNIDAELAELKAALDRFLI